MEPALRQGRKKTIKHKEEPMRRKVFIFPILFLFLIGIAACAGFNKNSYRGLGTMAVGYDVAMKSAADLHKKGLISDEGKAEIIELGESYAKGHNAAVQAFQDYLNAPEAEKETAQGKARVAMQASLGFYSELLSILTKYGVYGEPVKPWF
jgi:hypothetical protein